MACTSPIRVVPLPVLGSSQNYAYLVIDVKNRVCGAVDPAEPDTVLAAAEKEGVKITTVLTTHHHWDHADGNPKMASSIPNLHVVGADDRIPCLTHKVGEGDQFNIGDLQVTVRFTPCHTSGHVFYVVKSSPNEPLSVFTGDTLFIAGCGKFFEGTGEQMRHALMDVAAKLPPETLVWCGHEYTVSNLIFALSIEPENQVLIDKMKWAQERIAKKLYTVPSTIGEELSYNPFMRVNLPSVKQTVGSAGDSDAETMRKLRERKNGFR